MAMRECFLMSLVVVVVMMVVVSDASGAGRAFPIVSENYVIETFQRINPRLEWDPTNFLVDLSGQFANCRLISSRGAVKVDRKTQEGNSIVAYVDHTDGDYVDVNAVNEYLKRIVDRWAGNEDLKSYISAADRFGCSVRPGCSGQVSVSCLFSPGERASDIHDEPDGGVQKALAFTPEQYRFAESVTGNKWDRSHLLENLSGFETDCSMIRNPDWPFAKTRAFGKNRGMRLLGNLGYEPNYGSTPDALGKILRGMKRIGHAEDVGCSLIPDCFDNGQMYVVVSCIYQE